MVAALFMIGFVGFGFRFSFGVFFKSLQEDFLWSRATTSAVFSVYMGLSAIFTLLGGWGLDRYGARKVFTLSGFFTGLAFLLTSMVTASWQLFLTYSLFLSLGTAPIYVCSMSTVSRWFSRRRGLALGIVSCGNSMGMLVISPVSAFLITRYGWQNAYFILSLVAFSIMIPAALTLKKPPVMERILSDSGGKNEEEHVVSLREATKQRRFWCLIFILFFFSSCSYAVLTHIVPHTIDLGMSAMEAASMLSFIGTGSLLGRLIMGKASDVIGSKRGMLIASLLMAAIMFWLVGSSKLWMIYLFTIVFGFAFGSTAPLNAALIGDCFGLRHLGLIMGVIEIGWESGAAIGPAFAGYLFDIRDSYSIAFMGGGIAALLAFSLILFVRMPRPEAKGGPVQG
jgi:MFS family permease